MTKFAFILSLFLILSIKLSAQIQPVLQNGSVPVPLREVSGIVKDSTDQIVTGATITLTSKMDTLKTGTNENGTFVFKNVKQAVFVVTIEGIGFSKTIRKYLNNDVSKRIILDPIVLKSQTMMLNEVKVNGTPSIIYKTDTVEFRASDYKVRNNATVDELLKKMEGMEVGSDGTLTYQGQQVTKAKLNGKEFAGSDVAQAIQNLPADIVEKAQILNDYGDQAGRTGIKDGTPTPVLNLTTKADKSVGNMLRLTAKDGSHDRYDERVFAQRLDANEQIGVIANLTNTQNGVAALGATPAANAPSAGSAPGGTKSAAGSGGTTTTGGAAVNYRNQWGKSIQVNASYTYGFNDVNSINNSTGQSFSSLGTTSFITNSTGTNNNKSHNVSFELEYEPDSSNFLRVTPMFNYTDMTTSLNNQNTQSGFLNQYSSGISSSKNTTPTYGGILLYQHTFRKHPGRNISFQFNVNNGDQQQNTEQNTQIQYRDSLQHVVRDSIVHRMISRGNITKNYRASLTYTEPLTKSSQIDFNVQINYRGYENNAVTSNINPNGLTTIIDSLSNNYKYSFTENRFIVNYRLNKRKFSLSLGAADIPTKLDGTNISKMVSTDRSDNFFVPVFRFQYKFSSTQQISVNYTGTPLEPNFTQIQPLPDYSDPQNPVFGNPDLRPAFAHTIFTTYRNYIANSKINIAATVNTTFYQNQITTNVIQVAQPVLHNFLNEIHYINLDGSNSISGNYNISKQLDEGNDELSLNGTAIYNYQVGMSNNVLNHLTTWRVNERFGPRFNPNGSVEVNPFISYDINRTFNSLPSINETIPNNSDIRTAALNVEGKFYLLKDRTMTIEYNVSKNYVSGIAANISKNPLVANFYLEKEFFARKNGILRLSVFDLFDQNNFINHIATTTGYTDTKTNALSRYVSVSLILNLQKWTGIAKRDGKALKRRGDGSFIYN